MSQFFIGDEVIYCQDGETYWIEKEYTTGNVYLIRNGDSFCDMVPSHMLRSKIHLIKIADIKIVNRDECPLDLLIVDSVKMKGVLNPILVRETGKKDKYELLDGLQRIKSR